MNNQGNECNCEGKMKMKGGINGEMKNGKMKMEGYYFKDNSV